MTRVIEITYEERRAILRCALQGAVWLFPDRPDEFMFIDCPTLVFRVVREIA